MSDRFMTRRRLLVTGGAGVAALTLGACGGSPGDRRAAALAAVRAGTLRRDPDGVLDLAEGFRYRILQSEGDRMDGGVPVPGQFDGMAAFPGPGGSTVLVRNHELESGGSGSQAIEGVAPYDAGQPGGTSALVVSPDGTLERSYATSAGTIRNCAGGPTPWGTWLTCEETVANGHGYVFEVQPGDPEGRLARRPIRAMGALSHEAAGVDPATGIVYLTEDAGTPDPPTPSGRRMSYLYRYLPEDRSFRPGALHEGGRLQALAVDQVARRPEGLTRGRRLQVRWVDVSADEPHDDAVEHDALPFTRLEGAAFAGGALWFSDTEGGPRRSGRVYRYTPRSESLELFAEGTPENGMRSPDNVTVTPWGDVWFAEDRDDMTRIIGVTSAGSLYPFARSRQVSAELAGPTFSSDGRTFFVNIQAPGLTLAVSGPFPGRARDARAGMAVAAPPSHLAPRLAPEEVEAGRRSGLAPLEAAALARAGVPLG